MKKPVNKKSVALPRKRPQQARGVFAVQTIYAGFLTLWKDKHQRPVTTRAIAELTGFSVGAIYEYFPNSQAILSGYIRYLIDDLCQRLSPDTLNRTNSPWRQGLRDLLEITLGLDASAKYIDRAMILEESDIAQAEHHRLAFERLSKAWRDHIRAWPDLARPADDATINTLFVAVWGARRYMLLADITCDEVDGLLEKLQRMCETLLE